MILEPSVADDTCEDDGTYNAVKQMGDPAADDTMIAIHRPYINHIPHPKLNDQPKGYPTDYPY